MGLRVWCDLCWGALAPVKPSSGAEHGGAPTVQMPAVPRVDRRRSVTKPDLAKHGYTEECPACTQFTAGMQNAKVLMMTDAVTALASSWREMDK